MPVKRPLSLLSAALLSTAAPHAYAQSGYLFISSEKDNAVTVLDGDSYEVVKRIGTAARPRHMQFSPDGKRIFIAAGDGNAIDIVDVGKLELVDRITGIDDPELFDFGPDGGTLYISLEDDAKLGILDLDAYFAGRGETPELTVAAAAPVDDDDDDDDDDGDGDGDDDGDDGDGDGGDGPALAGLSTVEVGAEPEGILVSADGKTAYVTSEVANIVHVIDTASRTITHNVVVGNRPRRFALTPDGEELWVSNELSGSVTILDTDGYETLATIEFLPPGFRPEQVTPVGITITDDGKTAVVALGRANHVAFVDVVGREIEDYVLVGNRAWNTTLSADGDTLYVVNGLSDDVSVVDMQRRRVSRSIPVGRVPHTLLIDE